MDDLLIRGGELIDGTGAAARRADVAVSDGRIVAIGDCSGREALNVIDASGQVVGDASPQGNDGYLGAEPDIDDADPNWIVDDLMCPADLDGDGVVGINDFLALLAAWGPCP